MLIKSSNLNIIQELEKIEKQYVNHTNQIQTEDKDENNSQDWSSILQEQLLNSNDLE